MLPGVELARRRRLHHRHDGLARGLQELSAARPSAAQPPGIDDSATSAARRRLEEKLRRPFGGSRSPSSLSPASSFPRWMRAYTASAEDNSRQAQSSHESNPVLSPKNNSAAGKRDGQHTRRWSRTDICAVCLDGFELRQQVTWLPCAHRYHSSCVLPWLADHSHCPCCRAEVPSLELLSESALL